MKAAAFVIIGAAFAVTLGTKLYAFLHYRYTTDLSSPGLAVLAVALIGAAAGGVAFHLLKRKAVDTRSE